MRKPSLLFVGKQGDPQTWRALESCRQHFEVVDWLARRGANVPDDIAFWEGDYIVSYLSPCILPAALLSRAKVVALNFHPGPPEYPGIGCLNFALYDGSKEYGVTVHHMVPEVDAGPVVRVVRFPIWPIDTVDTVLTRTYDYLLVLFYEVLATLVAGAPLPASSATWRTATTRAQLNALGCLTPDMSREEMARRIRATLTVGYEPTIDVHGHRFRHQP